MNGGVLLPLSKEYVKCPAKTSLKLDYFKTQMNFLSKDYTFYASKPTSRGLFFNVTSYLELVFSDDAVCLYRLHKFLRGGSFSNIVIFELNHAPTPHSGEFYPRFICVKASKKVGDLDRDFRIYKSMILEGDFCDETIMFGYPINTRITTGITEPVIIMDRMDGSLYEFVMRNLLLMPFELRMVYTIYIVLELSYSYNCLFEKGYYYLDSKLDNCLYWCNNDQIHFFLADLGSAIMSGEKEHVTFPRPLSDEELENKEIPNKLYYLKSVIYGCIIMMLQLLVFNSLSFLYQGTTTNEERRYYWSMLQRKKTGYRPFKVPDVRNTRSLKELEKSNKILDELPQFYLTNIMEIINMETMAESIGSSSLLPTTFPSSDMPDVSMLPFLEKLYQTFNLYSSILKEKVKLPTHILRLFDEQEQHQQQEQPAVSEVNLDDLQSEPNLRKVSNEASTKTTFWQ